jgi:hypothetical protein
LQIKKAEKTAAIEKKLAEGEILIGTAEVAKGLKLDPKTLRKHLRAISGKAPGTRYALAEESRGLMQDLLTGHISFPKRGPYKRGEVIETFGLHVCPRGDVNHMLPPGQGTDRP